MAAPTPSYVRLVDDASNTGKKARTQSRVVGADTVHEHFQIPTSRRSKLGVHYYSPALQSVQASAQDGTSTGFLWIQNPIGSGITMVLREIALRFNGTAAAATLPRVLATKFTFTGTASGASVTPARRKTGENSPLGFIRTAVTGMTVTLGAIVASFIVPSIISASGVFPDSQQVWPATKDAMEEDGIELAPGEGVVIYQPDAGTAADPRRFVANIVVEEVE